jgi:glucose dehydrogenase
MLNRKAWALATSGVGALTLAGSALAADPAGSDWPTYGHDAGGARYSPLTQITPENVNLLTPA